MKNAEQPINNLEDILKSNYQVGVTDSSSTWEAFKKSQYDTPKKIWHRIQSQGTIAQTQSQGIQWVRERKQYLFVADGPVVRQVANQPPCDLATGANKNTSCKNDNVSFFFPLLGSFFLYIYDLS